jgi:hypothetical protein
LRGMNNKAGKGRMEIIESRNPGKVVIKLEFEKPVRTSNTTEFILIPDGKSTSVTWAMYGTNSYAAKIFGLFMNMDKMIGKDFQSGLSKLKEISEKQLSGFSRTA